MEIDGISYVFIEGKCCSNCVAFYDDNLCENLGSQCSDDTETNRTGDIGAWEEVND